jgi:hypothetical protein
VEDETEEEEREQRQKLLARRAGASNLFILEKNKSRERLKGEYIFRKVFALVIGIPDAVMDEAFPRRASRKKKRAVRFAQHSTTSAATAPATYSPSSSSNKSKLSSSRRVPPPDPTVVLPEVWSKRNGDGQDLTSDEDTIVKKLLATEHGRLAFAATFSTLSPSPNYPLCDLSSPAFDRLTGIVKLFCDNALSTMHVEPALAVMLTMQHIVKYIDASTKDEKKEDPNQVNESTIADDADFENSSDTAHHYTHRKFMLSALREHPIWQQSRFWSEAFFLTLHERLRTFSLHRWCTDEEQNATLQCRRKAVVPVLSEYANHMFHAGVRKRNVRAFVEKQATMNEIALDDPDMNKIRAEEWWNDALLEDEEGGGSGFGSLLIPNTNDNTPPKDKHAEVAKSTISNVGMKLSSWLSGSKDRSPSTSPIPPTVIASPAAEPPLSASAFATLNTSKLGMKGFSSRQH